MDHVRFDTEEKDNRIYVKVLVAEQRGYPLVPIVVVTTKDVAEHLLRYGHQPVSPIYSPIVHNKRNHHREGTWIFEKKILDKSPEPVIIEEEKSVQPKPKRTRRTRSSSKKVSTEE
tara:strand:- start:22 stop:369 length:348 start_codon:yes stop_codon:yes gene_type:complete